MNEPGFLYTAQIIESIITAIGILIAGLWAFTRFRNKRENETALSLDLETSFIEYDRDHQIVFFQAVLKNFGQVKIEAINKCKPAYLDTFGDGTKEIISYALDLKVRAIPGDLPGRKIIYWYPEPSNDIFEVDLLQEYEDYVTNNLWFWMEPGEEYKLGVPVILSPGNYLAKLTFLGKGKQEYWSRMFLIKVPPLKMASPTQIAHKRKDDKTAKDSLMKGNAELGK